MTSANSGRHRHDLTSIQILRGFAAISVVLFHAIARAEDFSNPDGPARVLMAGVDVFFVISGFIMVYSSAREPGRGPGRFLLDRATRIVPLYWLLTALVVAIGLAMPQVLHSGRIEAWHTIASFLFIPVLHPVSHYFEPVLIPGWTLNYEMFFYLLFAAGLSVAGGRIVRLCLSVGAVIVLLVLAGKGFSWSGIAAFYTAGIMLEFVFGMALAWLFLEGRALPPLAALLAILVGVLALIAVAAGVGTLPRELEFGLPALMIVAGALGLPLAGGQRVLRPLKWVGDASYSLYLSHPLAISALAMIWRRLGGGFALPAAAMLFVMAAALGCLAVAAVVYRLVERPLIAFFRRRL
jgi:exopolysaccharide production protein ExoZ